MSIDIDLPYLMECFLMMVNDQGDSADSIDFQLTCEEVIKIKAADLDVLREADKLLGKLSKEEREVLSCGDQDDWPPLFKKLGPNHELVHLVLDEVFENMMWGDETQKGHS